MSLTRVQTAVLYIYTSLKISYQTRIDYNISSLDFGGDWDHNADPRIFKGIFPLQDMVTHC